MLLDRIQNNNLDSIAQEHSLEKISSLAAGGSVEKEDNANLLIDETDISFAAIEKYQRELDVEKFSAILKETDEKEANELVLKMFLKKISVRAKMIS